RPRKVVRLECEFTQNPGEENRNERHATQRRADHRNPEARRGRVEVLSVLWLFQTTCWILLSLNRDLATPYGNWRGFEQFLPAFYFWAALSMACALKGGSRLLMIAAWVLLQLFYGAFMYT